MSSFLNLKDSLQDYFKHMQAWDKCQTGKRFIYINILGIPLQFWCLDFFNSVAAELCDFIAMSGSTMS